MERRELLKMIALVTGTAFIGGEFFLTGCKNPEGTSLTFSDEDITLLDEVGETIFPKTASAGAKEAKIGAFMKTWVSDCYPKESQEAFHAGIKKLNETCKTKFNTTFLKATPEQRLELLISLEQEAKDFNKQQAENDKPRWEALKKQDKSFDFVASPRHYYTMMKQMTIFGYFTSKEGATSALRFVPVPGRYDGNLDYKKGDKLFTGLD